MRASPKKREVFSQNLQRGESSAILGRQWQREIKTAMGVGVRTKGRIEEKEKKRVHR